MDKTDFRDETEFFYSLASFLSVCILLNLAISCATIRMMKKILAATALFSLIIFSAAAKVGVGVQGDLFLRSERPSSSDFTFKDGRVKPCVGSSITLASNHTPWVFALQVKPEPWYVGITADNWFVYKAHCRCINYFFFWGISGGMELEDSYGINTGARAGVGVNFFFAKRHLELYAQAAWNPYFGVNLKRGDGDLFFVKPINFPVNLGMRVWF